MTSRFDNSFSAKSPTDAPTSYTGDLLIAGRWTEGVSSAPILDKFSGQPWSEYRLPSREQVREAVAAARAAFRSSGLDAFARGAILDRAADLLEQRSSELCFILQKEAGFPHQDAVTEIKRCLATFRLSAEEARRFSGEIIPMESVEGQSGRLGFTMRVPLGVVCAITPFNAPLNTVAHKVAPAIAAGNAVILKPSTHTPISACVMAEALLAAGLPPGLLSVVHGSAEIAQWLMEEAGINFYAFTGSTEVGRIIQRQAGLRRTQMELGSIAHCVVCDDADLDAALPKIIGAAYRKAGQVCTSIQILLVQKQIFGEAERRLTEMAAALPSGDPADPATFVGPVISEDSARRIEKWIGLAQSAGARRLAGGDRKGSVISPTLMTDVDAGTPLGCEEIFGPVMCLAPFDTMDEVIRRINSTPYGLATGIFTNRLNDAFSAARALDVGGVHINDTSSSRVDQMPYGGSKDSGFGREGPRYAMREMSEERMITLRP